MTVHLLIFILSLWACFSAGLPGFLWLLAATGLTYCAGLLIPRRKWILYLSVGLHGGLLLFLKLQGLFGLSLTAPLGVSYVTLMLIGYCVDVSRGKYPPERNFYRFALCVTYYPKLSIGPIEGYDRLRSAFFENGRICWEGLSFGAVRALWGLFKKYVIAAPAGVVIGTISAAPETHQGAYALAAMVLFSVQLYADFSGGMDLVLGVSRMLGLRLSENFDRPYFSESVQEFWRRWHITLGAWLREYVYIPLGGNRKGKLRKILNTLIVFLVSGIWHGSHYLLWGLLNGIFVCIGKKLQTKWKTLNRVGTFLVVTFLWAFFVWEDTATALRMAGSVFTTCNYGAFFAGIGALGLEWGEWIVFFAGAVILWLADIFRDRLTERCQKFSPAARVAVICALGLVVLIFGMYGIGFVADDFIYSRF